MPLWYLRKSEQQHNISNIESISSLFTLFLLHPCLMAVITDRREMIEACGFLVVWRVVQTPFGGWDLLWEWHWVTPLAFEAFVVRHGRQGVLHDDLVVVWDKVIMDATCRLGWTLPVPIDVLVIACNANETRWNVSLWVIVIVS